jgi:hypothetical protein
MAANAGKTARLLLAATAVAASFLLIPSTASSQGFGQTATSCPAGNPYPGDDAPKEEIADWMARGSIEAGMPGELPVMAALVESGLQNLPDGDSDSAGYFQMRERYWDEGAYAGYATNPDLQLQWFTDQAAKVRAKWIADDRGDPALDEDQWGEWIADVERPAEQYRYRYQLRLDEARELIGDVCAAEPVPDGTSPGLKLKGRPEQRLRHEVAVSLRCETSCTALAKGFLRIRGGERIRLRPAGGDFHAGDPRLQLRLAIPDDGLRAARKALRHGEAVKAKLRVSVTDGAGNEDTGKRTVELGR